MALDRFACAVSSLPGDAQIENVAAGMRVAGGVAEAFPADVTDEADVIRLVDDITTRLGPIDVLVVNATGPQPDGDVNEVSWADHLAQLDFFVKSPVLLGRAVLPAMRDRGYGRIIHIDSEVADRPPAGRSAYATAKAAQVGVARSWGPPTTSPTPSASSPRREQASSPASARGRRGPHPRAVARHAGTLGIPGFSILLASRPPTVSSG